MGILDDAIREHLDLKRKHGAEEDEVQILEEEAFGPPSRPGDPDFPDRPPTGEEAVVQKAPPEEAPTGAEEPVPEMEVPVAEIEEPPPPPPDEPAGFYDHAADSVEAGEATVEHPAPLPREDDAIADEPIAGEPAAAEAPEATEPEAPPAESGEFEIGEIELELDEEFEEFRETGDEPAAAVPVDPDLGAPVSDESDEFAAVELDREDEDAQEEVAPAPAGEGEDVLEETPEFLRDTPEDERLWFEQGEPQDFDFDEEEDEEGEER